MAFIRKVKTKSGATAVQIAYSSYGKIVRIEHIGSAHNSSELEVLIELATQKLKDRQPSLFEPPTDLDIIIEQSVSSLLYETLVSRYTALKFNDLADPDFTNLVIARLVERTNI